MNRLAAAFVALALAAVALAATPPAEVRIPNKNGEITFRHPKHQAVKCQTCHGNGEGGDIAFTKKSGHDLCLACHKQNKEKGAPVSCKACHGGPKS